MSHPTQLPLAALIALALCGCGDGDADGVAPQAGTSGGPQAGTGASELPCGGKVPEFKIDMESLPSDETDWSARIKSATPAPPQKYENAWEVELLDGDGEPLADAELVFVEPWMPAHSHDGGLIPEIRSMEEPARFAVDRWMGGVWEVRLDVKSGDEQFRLRFDVCVPD